MIRGIVSLALLLSSFSLVAQTATSSDANPAAPKLNPIQAGAVTLHSTRVVGCPIDMHASQGLWDRTLKVRDGNKEIVPQKFGQRISLTLKDTHPARILSATVRARGLNGTNRTLPVPADTPQPWNAVKTLKVNFVEEREGTVSADLWIGGFTAVGSIELMNVSYSDGSVWTSSASACRVQPDPLMLITER